MPHPPPPTLKQPPFLLLLLLLLLLPGASSVHFDFSSLPLGSLTLLGDAHLKNGSIRLSRDLPVPNSGAGRALFASPVRLLHPSSRIPIPFSTFFSFSVLNLNPSSIGGGLAFLLAPDDRSLGDSGPFLGLLPSPSPFLAVEFDTLMDLQFADINDNHVGLDLNSLSSARSADLDSADVSLKSGRLVNAWIDYGHTPGLLQVFVSHSAVRPPNPVLSLPLDLARFVDEFMFVGFSASTQGSTEVHSIDWWSFSSSSSPASQPAESPGDAIVSAKPSPPAPSSCHASAPLCRQGPAAVAGFAAAGAAFFLAACAVLSVWAFARRRSEPGRQWSTLASAAVRTPREFSYRELLAATRGFSPARIIGRGAFGAVYKGIVPDTGAIVAVKRCINSNSASASSSASQGRSEFLSELLIIASLRHRHLVRLQGWCQQKGEILLVYDYMRHGSLDRALFDPSPFPSASVLPWPHRKKILAGVASALAYLHHECERQVIHRDVKSSNIMLDEDFHPRLGDFGLARQIDHDRSPDATVAAGTMGYLAPEYLLTGRASDKTDVYSFGALVLEVASGRRPIDDRRRGSLVEWVWELHGQGKLLEAVDSRMEGGFEEGEMRRVLLVGLGCSSPDPAARPGMRSVVQMLGDEAEPPHVPPAKPAVSFSANHQLLLSLQDSVSDCNAINGLNFSSSSSSSSCSLTSVVGGGGGGAEEGGAGG